MHAHGSAISRTGATKKFAGIAENSGGARRWHCNLSGAIFCDSSPLAIFSSSSRIKGAPQARGCWCINENSDATFSKISSRKK